MKFKWPRNKGELRSITKEQLNWLLSGLEIYQKKYFEDIPHKVTIKEKSSTFNKNNK